MKSEPIEKQGNAKEDFNASDDDKDRSYSSDESPSIRTNGKRFKNEDSYEVDGLAEASV